MAAPGRLLHFSLVKWGLNEIKEELEPQQADGGPGACLLSGAQAWGPHQDSASGTPCAEGRVSASQLLTCLCISLSREDQGIRRHWTLHKRKHTRPLRLKYEYLKVHHKDAVIKGSLIRGARGGRAGVPQGQAVLPSSLDGHDPPRPGRNKSQ